MPSIYPRIRNRIGASVKERKPCMYVFTMRPCTIHPLRDRLELAGHILYGLCVGWGEQSLVRTQVSANSCYDYPLPVCGLESGHVGQGRIVQGRMILGKKYGDASLLHRNLYTWERQRAQTRQCTFETKPVRRPVYCCEMLELCWLYARKNPIKGNHFFNYCTRFNTADW